MVDKRGLGGLGSSKPKSRLPSFWEFINPLSLPPGEIDQGLKGPTLRDVIVPPASTSPVRPPGLLQFLNPFSVPPSAEPISVRRRKPKRPKARESEA